MKLIVGEGVGICDECVDVCVDIIAEARSEAPPPIQAVIVDDEVTSILTVTDVLNLWLGMSRPEVPDNVYVRSFHNHTPFQIEALATRKDGEIWALKIRRAYVDSE